MRRVLFFILILLIAMVTGVGTTIAGSQPAAGFNFDDATYSIFGGATMGWEFTVNSDILVTDLGWIDTSSQGLSESHEVGIFDNNQDLLISTIVQAGTASVFIDGFRYESIEPIMLLAGESYVIAGRVYDDNIGIGTYYNLIPEFTLAPEISLVGGRTNGGRDLFNYPRLYFRANEIYLGPNFQFVPEPVTILLLGLGGVILRKRR